MGFLSLLLIAILSLKLTKTTPQSVEVNEVLAGVISCTNTSISSARTYAIVPQAKVEFVCGFSFFERVVKSTTTSNAGVYTFSFTTSDIVLSNPELCHLRVTLPPSSCTFDPPGGTLTFPIIGIRSSSGSLVQYIQGTPSYDR